MCIRDRHRSPNRFVAGRIVERRAELRVRRRDQIPVLVDGTVAARQPSASSRTSDILESKERMMEIVNAREADLTQNPHQVKASRLYDTEPVSYTHLRAHEAVLDLVCRLSLEKKKKTC
mgnify:CR=1 FL=1